QPGTVMVGEGRPSTTSRASKKVVDGPPSRTTTGLAHGLLSSSNPSACRAAHLTDQRRHDRLRIGDGHDAAHHRDAGGARVETRRNVGGPDAAKRDYRNARAPHRFPQA